MKQILTGFLLIMSHVVAIAQSKTNIDSLTKMGTISGCVIMKQMDTVVQTGTVAGRITDKDGEPITGAIVHIDLKGIPQKGMATDTDGNYFMTVAPGIYELLAQYAGMKKVTVKCTIIAGAKITCRNIKMEEESLCLAFSSLVDFFYPPLVDPDKPSTNKKFSAEQIEQMVW